MGLIKRREIRVLDSDSEDEEPISYCRSCLEYALFRCYRKGFTYQVKLLWMIRKIGNNVIIVAR